jgi:hypothetical protein
VGVNAFVAGMSAALRGQRFEDEDLVAEKDAVFSRFTYIVTLPDGSTASARTMAYYRRTGGRIVVNDVMSAPDLMPVLGPLMASRRADRRSHRFRGPDARGSGEWCSLTGPTRTAYRTVGSDRLGPGQRRFLPALRMAHTGWARPKRATSVCSLPCLCPADTSR